MKEKSTEELEQLKHLSLKAQATSKKCCDHWEECNTICMANQIYQSGAFTYENYLWYWLDIWASRPVQCCSCRK